MPDWLSKIAGYAPRIAAAIATGGTSELASVGLSVAGELLTGQPFQSKAQAEQFVNKATPDQLLLLKQADHQFELRCKELEMQDRADTREAVVQSEKYANLVDFVGRRVINHNLLYVMGLVVIQLVVLVLAIKYIPNEAAMVIGIIGNLAGVVIAGLLKERQDVVSLLFGAKPNSGPVLDPTRFKLSPPSKEEVKDDPQRRLLD